MTELIKTQKYGVTVRLTIQRRLDQALSNAGIEDPTSVSKLTIVGTMTKLDFKFICKKMSKSLQELDISKATWEEGKLRKGAFAYCFALTSIVLPDWILEISDGAFSNCCNLKSINFPKAVTKIGELSFWGCTSLTSVVIPETVTELGFRAFNNCTALTSINIPKSVVKIAGSVFGKCSSLTSIIIPESVTEIGNGAFSHCTGLTEVFIHEKVDRIGDWIFEGCDLKITIHPDNPVYTMYEGKIVTRFFLANYKK